MATKKKRGLLAECIYYLGHFYHFCLVSDPSVSVCDLWPKCKYDTSVGMSFLQLCCLWVTGFSFWLRRLGLTFWNALFLQQHILPSRWYYGGKLWMWGIRKNLFIISTATRMESRTFFLLIRSPKEKAPVFICIVFASFCLLAEISFQCSQ